jgi:hypothetical protein
LPRKKSSVSPRVTKKEKTFVKSSNVFLDRPKEKRYQVLPENNSVVLFLLLQNTGHKSALDLKEG